jgi:hypothetical protein
MVLAIVQMLGCDSSVNRKRKGNKPSDQGETISGYIRSGQAAEVSEGNTTISMKSGVLTRDARVLIKTAEEPITDEASAHLGSIDGTAVNIEFVDPDSGEMLGDDILNDSYQYSKSFDDIASAEDIYAVIVSNPGTSNQSTNVLDPGEFESSSTPGLRLTEVLKLTLNLSHTSVQVWFGTTTSPNRITRRSSSTGSSASGENGALNLATPGKLFVMNPNSPRAMTARNLDGSEIEIIKYGKGNYSHLYPTYDAANDRLFFVADGGTRSANQFSIMRYAFATEELSEVFTGYRTGNTNSVTGEIKALSLSPDGNSLFLATQTNKYEIFKFDANANSQNLGPAIISQMSVDFYAMAVSNSKIFWVDKNELRSVNHDGTQTLQLNTNASLEITSIELDPANQKIYMLYKSNPSGYIRRINFDGTGLTTIFNLESGDYAPIHLRLDVTAQKFYYCNLVSPRAIRSVDLNGTNSRTGANISAWDCTNGFALDRDRMKIYFDGKAGTYTDTGNFGNSSTPTSFLSESFATPATVHLVDSDKPALLGWDGACSIHSYDLSGKLTRAVVSKICTNPTTYGHAGIRTAYSDLKSVMAWSALQPDAAGAINAIPNSDLFNASVQYDLSQSIATYGGNYLSNSASGSSVAVNPLTGNVFYGLNSSNGDFNLYKLSADNAQFNLIKTIEQAQTSGIHKNIVIDPSRNKIFIRELDAIAVINTDGSGYSRLIVDDSALTPNWGLAVEPTNGWIYFAKKRDGTDIFELFRANIDGSDVTNLGPQDIGADSDFYVVPP